MLAGFSFELSLGSQIIIYSNNFKASTREGPDREKPSEVNYSHFLDKAKTLVSPFSLRRTLYDMAME